MKFFHLSDLHIGLKLMNRDLREEQMDILRQVTDLAREEQPDAVVIAGDIYDKAVPAAEAVEVFDSFITELKRAVPEAEMMLISGNHDSGLRLNCFREILDEQKVHMIGRRFQKNGHKRKPKWVIKSHYGKPLKVLCITYMHKLLGEDELRYTIENHSGNKIKEDQLFASYEEAKAMVQKYNEEKYLL